MSNGTDFVSPTRLGSYLYCPRKYDFEYVQRVETVRRGERYLQQGRALHTTIERTCRSTDADGDASVIHRTARQHFTDAWKAEVDRQAFASDAHHEYFRRLARAGIDAYFDPSGGPGLEHARTSVAVERRLSAHHRGVPIRGFADNILRPSDGSELHIIDYKRTLRDILSDRSTDCLESHLDDDHDPRRVKSAIQAAAYIEGVKETELYEPGMTVRFSFYGLLNRTETNPDAAGYSVSARGYDRELTEIYESNYDAIWELITDAYRGIQNEAFEPEPWELIREHGCEDCEYSAMCPERIASEVQQ